MVYIRTLQKKTLFIIIYIIFITFFCDTINYIDFGFQSIFVRFNRYRGESTQGIELSVLNSTDPQTSMTPPVQCSSRNSMCEGSSRGSMRKGGSLPADSMEYINRLISEDTKGSGIFEASAYSI